MALPSVVIGKQHTIRHLVAGPCLAVKFRTAHGHITVEAVMQSR